MQLFLFALACLVTLLLIRFMQRSSPKRGGPDQPEEPPRPAVSEEEIVDVRFEEYSGHRSEGEKKT